MRALDLTMPLDYEWMPDELFPTATQFLLAPRGNPEKGITVGTDSGTALLLPAQFAAFRGTRRLHEIEPAELVLRATAVVDLPCPPRQAIDRDTVYGAIERADFRDGDALLLRTGWGDQGPRERGHDRYLVDTPRLTLDAADWLIEGMQERGTSLLLTDTALLGYPDKHLVPEWLNLTPRPLPWPSEAARGYLAGYLEREVLADWAVEYRLAEAGIMTVTRLVGCGAIAQPRVRLIVAPLLVVRGVGATCRVVALEEEAA
ncbi:MAG TPA: cyclase family protein [Chloroflexota bacterium]|jgi:kynurenine formamidase